MGITQPVFHPEEPEFSNAITPPAQPTPIREPLSVDILLVHGDLDRQRALTVALDAAGHDVSTTGSVDGAIRLLRAEAFEVLVLCPGYADHSLLDATRAIRAVSDLPLIALGPSAGPALRDAVIDGGADDYLVEPVEPSELDRLARARARRANARRRIHQLMGPGGISMHVRAHEAFVGEERLQLTPKEFAILRLLLERRGEVIETDEISLNVWGHGTYGSRNFVEAHISRLRQKLGHLDASSVISTVRGIGYVIR